MKAKPTEPRARTYKPRHNEAFKRQAVDLYHRSGKSMQQVADELGISKHTLRSWVYGVIGSDEPQTPEQMQGEIKRLKDELARVTEQREILKKSLGILSKP